MKMYHVNPGVNRTENWAATAASIKQKCYSFTIMMYYLNYCEKAGMCVYVIISYIDNAEDEN